MSDNVVADHSEMGPVLEMFDPSGLDDAEIVPERAIRQESIQGVHSPQELVHCNLIPPDPCHSLQPLGLHYYWQRVSCTRDELVNVYCRSRKRLGNSVEDAHGDWCMCVARGCIHPVLKACALAFSVISTPETTAYLTEHWLELWRQMDHDSPDYKIARFMAQYALAWAVQSQDLPKAFQKVVACYSDMHNDNPENFFLAPFYTVTIGRWIFEFHDKEHNLSVNVIAKVLYYANETLRLIGTLEDDWARIDTFAVKLSALKLLMLVEGYCKKLLRFRTFCRDLSLRIDRLYEEISQEFSQNRSQIVMYEEAWFHSVSATYYKNASIAAISQDKKEEFYTLGQRSLAQAARLYHENGRWWRAYEEAKRADDPEIKCKYSKQRRNAPSIC